MHGVIHPSKLGRSIGEKKREYTKSLHWYEQLDGITCPHCGARMESREFGTGNRRVVRLCTKCPLAIGGHE